MFLSGSGNVNPFPTSIINPLNHTLGDVDYNPYGGPTTMNTAQGGNATVQYDPVTLLFTLLAG